MGELYDPYPKLPRNIRQIGERDQSVRLYLEDYVNTYLKRLYPKGGQDLRAGVLLGTAEDRNGTPYLFVDGALEMEDVTETGEKVAFTDAAWKKTYQAMEQMFPKRVILGWFLCGAAGSALSPVNYWKAHGQYFAGKNQLMYLNSGLDGEEAVYVAAADGFYRLKGYSIYYERNQMMQDYMILRKDVRRVETGAGDPVIRDFRQRMDEAKSEITSKRSSVRVLGGLCTALGILVLAGGVLMMNNYEKMKQMEAVLASVLPSGAFSGETEKDGTRSEDEDGEVIVEQAAGRVYRTIAPETMAEQDPNAGTAAEGGDGDGQASSGSTVQFHGTVAEPENSTGGSDGADTGDNSAGGGAGSADGSGDSAGSGSDSAGGSSEDSGGSPSGAENGGSGENAGGEDGGNSGAQASVQVGQRVYMVQPGDTLYGICLSVYGDGSQMDEICRINNLENQDKISAGQKLILP